MEFLDAVPSIGILFSLIKVKENKICVLSQLDSPLTSMSVFRFLEYAATWRGGVALRGGSFWISNWIMLSNLFETYCTIIH